MSVISVQPGGVEGFFDVSFDDAAHDAAGVDPDAVSGISVEVDAVTGAVTLNRGYDFRSDAGHAETDLFRFHGDEIVAALVEDLSRDASPAYDAFRTAHAPAPAP